MRWLTGKGWTGRWALAALGLALSCRPASALVIELDDVASDRVERQRAYTRGATPLPGTPDLANLDGRLEAKGLARGNPIFIRIFKETSELELWMQPAKDKPFVLLAIYPICHWTGSLGPKLKEGDRQSPEGFYTVRWQQTRLFGRWQQAFNLGFPNVYDQINGRTGSHILVHGGCSSVGCYAMTEQVQAEIFGLAIAAIEKGHHRFHVHVFPFRPTDEAMQRHRDHLWIDFWRDLKAGYDSFERTRLPPRFAICDRRYQVSDGEPEDAGNPAAHGLLRPPATPATLASGYVPPRCEIPGERNHVARVTPTAASPDEPAAVAPVPSAARERQAPARDAFGEPPPPQKPRRRVRATEKGEPGTRGNQDNGLGVRLAPGAPRVHAGGG